jgi:hypothetical protein
LLLVLFTTFRAHSHIIEHFRTSAQTENFDYADQIRLGGGFEADPESSTTAYDPHIQRSDLKLEISPSKDAATIIVTATNQHPQSSIDLLVWDSPFDPDAVSRCIFEITESRSGARVPCKQAIIPRERPPKAYEYVEVAALHAITAEYAIKKGENGTGVDLEKGKEYDASIKSKFRGIWRADISKINKVYLYKTGGASGMIDWEYESVAKGIVG